MKHCDNQIRFPLKLIDEEEEVSWYDDLDDLKCNLEDFDSDKDEGFTLTDALGRDVFLRMSLMDVLEFRLKGK